MFHFLSSEENVIYNRIVEFSIPAPLGKGDRMAPINVPMLLSVFEIMIENELALAEFYQTCSEFTQKDSSFWHALAETEKLHAENIRRISEIVKSRPDRFEAGRPFNTVALKTIISYIRRNIADLKEGRLLDTKPFFLAMDLENSVLETRYFEIVKSKDLEFQDLSSAIMKETFDHRDSLKMKVDSLKHSLSKSEPRR
ncbi:MAG: hypothetical protein CVU57_17615 [Deltaproteobacteria bacterium HGW-Deltaproteobacteria-15]|nr:MAG: hypothetical protein CVU57_17615 [Deltaproteobacteria bacterium HGW-Deltaproteobacteria-15]